MLLEKAILTFVSLPPNSRGTNNGAPKSKILVGFPSTTMVTTAELYPWDWLNWGLR